MAENKRKKKDVVRTFPVGKTVLLVLAVLAQMICIAFAVFYDPQPQDVIREYEVTVVPCEDGSLDIEYRFVWTALDSSEALTWVEIGVPNYDYSVYYESLSSNISYYEREEYDGYTALILNLDRAYMGGETLEFSFKINQGSMLCKNGSDIFYEFIPGWFNATPVESYCFKWLKSDDIVNAERAAVKGDFYVWSGSLDCGEYETMRVDYDDSTFVGCKTVYHTEFDDSGTYNELWENKLGIIFVAIFVSVLLLFAEIYIIDCYVSYDRGRGFLTGYGYHIHVHGRTNPIYVKARTRHMGSPRGRGFGGGGGGGCACACACACAGGGRAGCSQKDTYNPDSASQNAEDGVFGKNDI